MTQAYICDAIRTPIGRYGGALASVRPDDLAAIPLAALKARNPGIDWAHLDDVILGCANQAGEDNRNVARMAALLGGLGDSAPGTTINRLCGSGLDAVSMAARAIKAGEADLIVAGGVESMTRAPFVMPKADAAFSRANIIYDTTIGWRFVNLRMKAEYGVDSLPETAENVAGDSGVSREDQDLFAHTSQQRAAAAPSLTPLALPAVMVPPSRTIGLSLASASRLVRRGCSSVSNMIGSPLRCGIVTATISAARRPLAKAAAARCWLVWAKRS